MSEGEGSWNNTNITSQEVILEKRRNDSSVSREKPKNSWELSGVISVGRRRRDGNARPFKISFKAFKLSQAIKMGLERLKTLANRERNAARETDFWLSGVCLAGGDRKFPVKKQYHNKRILLVDGSMTRSIYENLSA